MTNDRVGTPAGVASVLTSLLERIDPERRIRLWQTWEAAVGDQIASRAQPVRFSDGVLVVNASSHTWAQELQLLRDDLLIRINRALGEELVREIQITTVHSSDRDPPLR